MSTVRATNFQHASAANPAIVLAADGSATANVSSINNGPLAGMRNAIINGNFDIWQRGTSFTGSEFGADRWLSYRVGTTHTATRQAFTLGQTDVPGEPTYFIRTVVSSVAGAANASLLQQRIEDVRTFAGQQVTASFWAKADASKPIAIEFAQSFGEGGSPSAVVESIDVTKVTLSTSWQKVTVTANIPSISGKTLGSDNNSRLSLLIYFDAGSNFNSRTDTLGQQSGTFDIAQVQVEPGPVATPFERRPIGTELSLCQRYYEKLFFGGQGYAPAVGNIRGGAAGFATTKRASPSITLTAVNYNNASTAQTQLFGEPTTGFVHFAASTAAGVFYYDGIAIASAEL
jgi:hypothetical protein